MDYTELERPVKKHMWTGIILSLVVALSLLLAKYEKNLSETIGKFEIIRTNTAKMKEATEKMSMAMNFVTTKLPSGYYSRSHREFLLLALDDIKTTLKNSDVTITGFDEKPGELSLPLNISVPVADYTVLVNQIGYLQSLKFPHFTIRRISIEKSSGGSSGSGVPQTAQHPVSETASGVIICKIEGALKMPSEKLRDGKR